MSIKDKKLFVHYCDDDKFMCMTAITDRDFGRANIKQFDDVSAQHTLAITFHQGWPVVGDDSSDEVSRRFVACWNSFLGVETSEIERRLISAPILPGRVIAKAEEEIRIFERPSRETSLAMIEELKALRAQLLLEIERERRSA